MADETGAVVPSEDRTTVSIKLDVPDILKVPEGSLLLLQALGEGVQVYDCKPSANDPAKGAWTFREPKSTPLYRSGNIVGTHFKGPTGPTWQANDGSTVGGAIVHNVSTDPSAIPSLLLSATAHDGSGLLSTVSFIQRLDTVGGKAPESCDLSHESELPVKYTALYRLYGPVVPSSLKVVLLFQALGKGLQVYDCKPSPNDPAKGAWTFKEPKATLYDDAGNIVGTHFKGPTGPTWQANDGSTVVGFIVQNVCTDPSAIPSLKLSATSHDGSGLLSTVLFIQRVDTVGGKAPDSCDLSQDTELPVKYTALYRLYGPVVPSSVKVVLLFQALGKGVQVYDCKPSTTDPAKGAWTFKEPKATLYDDAGNIVGTHFKGPTGPTWQANDGSTVVGKVLKTIPTDPNAIPSLLLAATPNEGCGLLSKVIFIQRVD